MEQTTCYCGKAANESGRCNDGGGFHVPQSLPAIEQTITPEEQRRGTILQAETLAYDLHRIAERLEHESDSPNVHASDVPRTTAISFLRAASSSLNDLLGEIPRVRQEALAQGWDECADATKKYMVVELDPTIPDSLKERNPHRSHA